MPPSTLLSLEAGLENDHRDQHLVSAIHNVDTATFESLLTVTPPPIPASLTACLNTALRTNKPDFVRILLNFNAPFDRNTGLDMVRGENPDTVRLLIAHGLPPNGAQRGGHDARPIEVAIAQDNLEIAMILLEAGAFADSSDLKEAVRCASTAMVALLLEKAMQWLYPPRRISALQEAASVGRTDMIDYLVGLGWDVNDQSSLTGATALGEALRNMHVDAVVTLLCHGADPDLKSRGKTPLEIASELENCEVREDMIVLLMDPELRAPVTSDCVQLPEMVNVHTT